MGYLTPGDYKKSIQADNLNQVIGNDPFVLEDAESTAVEEVKSYLVQKYETGQEFTDTTAWSKADTYKGLERVYLTAPAYSTLSTYSAGDYVTYQPNQAQPIVNVYRSLAGNVPHAFVPGEWELIAQQYTIYSPVLPAPVFDNNAIYKPGDVVFWRDKVYTCVLATNTMTQEAALQYYRYENVPPINVFPDDKVNGALYWGAGVAYTIAPGVEITDVAKWVKGDNRCKQIVLCVVSLTLYFAHARIAPRNIPDLRIDDKDRTYKTLKMFAEGATTPTLPMKQPRQGARIRYGGNVKNNNTY